MNGTPDETPLGLKPNALLILSVIDAMSGVGSTCSPKSDEVGWKFRKDGAWVHRHGKDLEPHLATLSTNGHCFLTKRGEELARRVREDMAPPEAPPTCGEGCSAGHEGPCTGGRQLYACGVVRQWCPDHVPGEDKADINPRSRKAQHEGVWFQVTQCTQAALRYPGRVIPASETSDGTPLLPETPVVANAGSGASRHMRENEGFVIAAASGVALVSWPGTEGRGRVAEVLRSDQLLLPGALDLSGLSDHQTAVVAAYRSGEAVFEQDEDGLLTGTLAGRRINPRTVAILVERGAVSDEPWDIPAAPGMRR